MKKFVIITLAILVLLGAGFGVYRMLTKEEAPEEAELQMSALPVVSFYLRDGRLVNQTHGYVDNMEIPTLRDTVVPTDGTHTIKARIDNLKGSSPGTVRYVIYDLTGTKEMESGEIVPQAGTDGGLELELSFSDVWKDEREVILCFVLPGEGEQEIRYFSRVTRDAPLNTERCVQFAYDFCEQSRDRTHLSLIGSYMEPDASGDRNSQQHVTIHSAVEQVMWGNLTITDVTEPKCKVKESTENYTSLVLTYTCSYEAGEESGRFSVREFYRIRCGKRGMSLLDFDRTLTEEIDARSCALGGTGIELGMVDQSTKFVFDETGNQVGFVNSGVLWKFQKDEGVMTRVFPCTSQDGKENPQNAEILPMSVDTEGNMVFAVVGYRAYGPREGRVGIEICDYTEETGMVRVVMFIPAVKGEELAKLRQTRSLYYNRLADIAYLFYGNNFYAINGTTGEAQVLLHADDRYAGAGDLCVFSTDGKVVAYPNRNSGAINVLNMDTGGTVTHVPDRGMKLLPIGFIGKDLIYGTAQGYSGVDDEDNEVTPMTSVQIVDEEGTVVKTFEQEGSAIIGASLDDYGLVTLVMATRTNGVYIRTGEEYITTNQDPEEEVVRMEDWQHSAKKRVVRLAFAESFEGDSVKVKRATMENDENVLEFLAEEDSTVGYAAYGGGRLIGIFQRAGSAIIAADKEAGVVLAPNGQYTWERGNRDLIYAIEGASLDDIPEGKVDLSGVTAEQLCYVINQNRPILAMLEGDKEILLTGYDLNGLFYIDVESGSAGSVPFEKADTQFRAGGLRFYCD